MKNTETLRIVFVNQYVNHLFVDIVNVFAAKGYSVILITGGIYSGKPDTRVKIIKLNAYKRSSFFNRIFTWKLFTFLTFCILPFTKGKLVLSSNPPFLFPLVSMYSRIFNRQIYPVIYDLYPDALIKFGYLKENATIIRIWKRLNSGLFRKSSAVFTISPSLTAAVQAYARENEHFRIEEIPVWGDDLNIQPVEKHENPFLEKYGLRGRFVVQYSGNFGLTHNIEAILEAARVLKEDKEICFLMIGEGAKQRLIENFVKVHNLPNVVLLPWQPVEELAYSLSAADIGLITLAKNAEAVSLPSKTFSYLKAGVPVFALSESSSDLAGLISEFKTGVVCNAEDGESLAREILALRKDAEALKKYAQNALRASGLFSSDNAQKFYKVINATDPTGGTSESPSFVGRFRWG